MSINLKTQKGFTLIELLLFIVIVSFALAGLLTVFNTTVKNSADPMIKKQMLSIGESLMQEVQAHTFSWCDPSDANAATATDSTFCAGVSLTKTRASTINPLDRVIDYHGLTIDTTLAGLAFPQGYTANIRVIEKSLHDIVASESYLIEITVNYADESIILHSFRTRYAPNNIG